MKSEMYKLEINNDPKGKIQVIEYDGQICITITP